MPSSSWWSSSSSSSWFCFFLFLVFSSLEHVHLTDEVRSPLALCLFTFGLQASVGRTMNGFKSKREIPEQQQAKQPRQSLQQLQLISNKLLDHLLSSLFYKALLLSFLKLLESFRQTKAGAKDAAGLRVVRKHMGSVSDHSGHWLCSGAAKVNIGQVKELTLVYIRSFVPSIFKILFSWLAAAIHSSCGGGVYYTFC